MTLGLPFKGFITAHFIDDEWKLHKIIISFVPGSSHKSEYITKAMKNCLLDWGLKNVFSVTIDNALSNDIAMWYIGVQVVLELNIYMLDVLHIF